MNTPGTLAAGGRRSQSKKWETSSRHRPPVQPGLPRPGEEVAQVVRVRLDGVRRRRYLQVRKVRFRWPDRQAVIA
jgi:hypothetical protein